MIDSTFPCPADDFQSSVSPPLAGGMDSLLSEEDDDEFFDLHIIKHEDSEVSRRSKFNVEPPRSRLVCVWGGEWAGGDLYPPACSGEGGGFLGLNGARVPPAESADGGRPEGVPDGPSGAPAEPPRPHAARPEEAPLRQRRREAGRWPSRVARSRATFAAAATAVDDVRLCCLRVWPRAC